MNTRILLIFICLVLFTYQSSFAQYFQEKLPIPESEVKQILHTDTSITVESTPGLNLNFQGDNSAFFTLRHNSQGLNLSVYNLSTTATIEVEIDEVLDEPMITLRNIDLLHFSDSTNVTLSTTFRSSSGTNVQPIIWKMNKFYPGVEIDGTDITLHRTTDTEVLYSTINQDIQSIKFTISNSSNTPLNAISLDLASLLHLKNTEFRSNTVNLYNACESSNIVMLLDNSSSVDSFQKQSIVDGIFRMLDSLSNENLEDDNSFTILSSSENGGTEELFTIEGNFESIRESSQLESVLANWSSDTTILATNLSSLVNSARNYIHPQKENIVVQVYNGYHNGNGKNRKPRHKEINHYLKWIDKIHRKKSKFLLLSFEEMSMDEARSMSDLINGLSSYTSDNYSEFNLSTYYHYSDIDSLFVYILSGLSKTCDSTQQRSIKTMSNQIDNNTFSKIYPNPVEDIVRIELSNKVDGQKYSIYIRNIYGKIVWNNHINSSINRIPMSSFPSGMYYVELRSNNHVLDIEEIVKH